MADGKRVSGTMEVRVGEWCPTAYSYAYRIAEHVEVAKENERAGRMQLEGIVARRLRGTNLGFQPCPLCGDIQSWMGEAVRESAGKVLLASAVLIASVIARCFAEPSGGGASLLPIVFAGLAVCIFCNFPVSTYLSIRTTPAGGTASGPVAVTPGKLDILVYSVME